MLFRYRRPIRFHVLATISCELLEGIVGHGAFRPPYPVSPFRYELFYYQKADLLCLLALLSILVIRLIRPLPLRMLVLIALLVNLYKLCEWGSLIWHGRYWGSGAPQQRALERHAILDPGRLGLSRASWFELAEGPLMIAVVAYLLVVLFVARRLQKIEL